MTGKRLAGFIAALGLGLGLPGSSTAASITWFFEGQVNYVAAESDEALETLSSLGVSLGSFFSGQLVFESTTSDEDPDPSLGLYPGAVLFFSVTIGSFHEELAASPSVFSTIEVQEFPPEQNSPGYFFAYADGPFIDDVIGNSPELSLLVSEEDPGQISSDALPLFPPGRPWSGDVSTTDYSDFFVSTLLFTGGVGIGGIVTEMAPVPAPGVTALVVLSLVAVGALRRCSS